MRRLIRWLGGREHAEQLFGLADEQSARMIKLEGKYGSTSEYRNADEAISIPLEVIPLAIFSRVE